MKVLNTAAHLRSQTMVRKTSRCFALASLLALTLLSPTASLQAGERSPAEPAGPQLSPLESLWQVIVSAACEHGVSIGPEDHCNHPANQAGCDGGPLIDPNGRCAH
jgi:hypothetical protein